MIERLTKYYERCHNKKQSLTLDIIHDKYGDWQIEIVHNDSQTIVFRSNECSLNLLCAEAYIALEDWASGYAELEDIECNL